MPPKKKPKWTHKKRREQQRRISARENININEPSANLVYLRKVQNMANEDCDYDDLISQNILIRREEKEDKTGVVEVLKKENDDYENLYQKQADIYRMDIDVKEEDNDGSNGEEEEDDSSDFEVIPAKQREISPDYDDQASSSDSDWGMQVKRKKCSFECDECDKKCATKRGLLVHKRFHARQKAKMKQNTKTPTPPVPDEVTEEEETNEIVKSNEEEESAKEVSEKESNGDKENGDTDDENNADDASLSPDNNDNGQTQQDDDEEEEEEEEDDDDDED